MSPLDDETTSGEAMTPNTANQTSPLSNATQPTRGLAARSSSLWQSVRQSVRQKMTKSERSDTNGSNAMDAMLSPALSIGLGSVLTAAVVVPEGNEPPSLSWLQTILGLSLVDAEKVPSQPLEDVLQRRSTDPEENTAGNDLIHPPATIESGPTKVPVVAVQLVSDDSPLADILGPLLNHQGENIDTVFPVVVSTVNGAPCTTLSDVNETIEQVEVGQAVTIQCEIEGGHDKLVHAVVLKPTPDTQLGVTLQHSKYSGGKMLLTVDKVAPSSLLEHSPLQKGDLILAINGESCHEMPPADAVNLMRSTVAKPLVSILALQPGPSRTQRFLRQAKRAGVAVGGGAMVGIGLVFIPTLPPPFGEVLIAGGVSFLATEFEGPRRVVRSCRDSLERAVGREEGTTTSTITTNDNDETESTDGSTTIENEGIATESSGSITTDSVQDHSSGVSPELAPIERQVEESSALHQVPPQKTLKSRLKNFGRNHVLPFLDQVVGDRPDGKSADSKVDDKSSERNMDQSGEEKKSEG